MFVFTQRDAVIEQCRQAPSYQWDLVIIGGGIVGAGILKEASKQGLNALLIEQKDFAWGTSSRSSKMVHGGLRYIAKGDIKLTKHSLQERERLLKEYPHFVKRMGYYFLFKKGQFPGRFVFSILLSIYDWLAGIKDHRYVSKQEVQQRFKGIKSDKLNGACYYTDTVVDDARLVLRVLQDAIDLGGAAINYVKAVDLIKGSDNKTICGVMAQGVDNEAECTEPFKLNAKVVINATGAWADRLRMKVIDEKRIRPLRGSHILFDEQKIKVEAALTLFHPTDKRAVFIFPWENTTVVGTTDLDHRDDLDNEASITPDEVSYLLELVNDTFPHAQLTQQDILSSYAGVRPIIGSDKNKDPSKERRDHAVWADNGLITVSGGKLTTFRLIALDVLKSASPWLKAHDSSCNEARNSNLETASPLLVKPLVHDTLTTERIQHIQGVYGKHANALLEQSISEELELIHNTPFCLAQCRWAIKYEAVKHLDDLLLRRTRLGLLLPLGAACMFDDIRAMFEQELQWTSAHWEKELACYQQLWKNNYSAGSHDDVFPVADK